jgi:hypothetical protein
MHLRQHTSVLAAGALMIGAALAAPRTAAAQDSTSRQDTSTAVRHDTAGARRPAIDTTTILRDSISQDTTRARQDTTGSMGAKPRKHGKHHRTRGDTTGVRPDSSRMSPGARSDTTRMRMRPDSSRDTTKKP